MAKRLGQGPCTNLNYFYCKINSKIYLILTRSKIILWDVVLDMPHLLTCLRWKVTIYTVSVAVKDPQLRPISRHACKDTCHIPPLQKWWRRNKKAATLWRTRSTYRKWHCNKAVSINCSADLLIKVIGELINRTIRTYTKTVRSILQRTIEYTKLW